MSSAFQMTKAAQAGDRLIQLVTFKVNQEEYAVEVTSVREIMRLPAITTLPQAPSYVEGIISLRGSVIPIISLRERFSLTPVEDDTLTRIMVMTVEGRVVGFKVDAVTEVIRVPSGEVQPPPSLASLGGEQQSLAGVIRREQRLIVMLDPERLLAGVELDFAAEAA